MIPAITAASVRFRLLVAGVAVLLVVLGVVSLRTMHDDVVPELGAGPVLEVQTEALGLSSQEVEQYVTVPLENNLLDGIMHVWDVRSQSIPGLSTVDLYFEPGTTTLHARQLVEERLTNAFSLPNISKPPQLIQPLSSSSRVLLIGLRSRGISALQLSYLARWVIKPRLSGVPGVANVAIFGQRDRQLQVLVDPARLATAHDTLAQIIQTAGNAQLVSPLSYLEGSSPGTGGFLDGANQRLEIRPVLPLGAPRNLASVPVSGGRAGQRLGSVSTVVEGHQPLIGDALVGTQNGLVLEVQRLPSASVRGVTDGVEKALAALRPALPGVRIDTSFFRPATYVQDALGNLELALLIGCAVAVSALVALLLDARAAFVAAVSVGLSLVSATLLLQAFGYTFDALVLAGLLLASIVLVDDAVHAGDEPLRAKLAYATVIIALVVAPVFFADGTSATFVHPMVLAFLLAIASSLALSVTVAPALGRLLFGATAMRPRGAALARRVAGGHRRVVLAVMRVPAPALGVVLLAGLIGAIGLPFVRQPAPPVFRDRDLVVRWEAPPGTALSEMTRLTRRVLGQLDALPAVASAAATLGRAVGADQIVDTSSGEIYVALRPGTGYDAGVQAVRAVVDSTPGMDASVGTYESAVMPGVLTPGRRQVTVRVYGEDYRRLTTLSRQMQAVLAGVHGLGPSAVHAPAGQPNIEVSISDSAALRAGVLPGDARRQASTLVSGMTVGNFFQDQAVFDVVVQGMPSVRRNLDDIRNLEIDTGGGGHVRLGDIANVAIRSDPIDVGHEALSRYVDVTAPVYAGTVGGARAAIRARLAEVTFPLGYHAEVPAGAPDSPTSHPLFMAYALAAAIGMLLLLQVALDSWRLAALLFLVVPVALTGGLIVAVASGTATELGADAGLLAVFAYALRQALVLTANVRRAHAREGRTLTDELVVRASAERLGPVLAATAVSAAGLIPFAAMGNVAGNELTHTAAAVMLGGLLTTTVLVLVLLPALILSLGPRLPVAHSEPAAVELEEARS